ncbi:MAG: hypothetical protein WDN04_22205 [Rhodospirillales bacterium]
MGEPYGTLILTISVTFIEVVSISAVMLHGKNNPTLARDTLFAVVMIVLNGMVGLSLLVGGLRHREQHYNLQGANAYIGVILPLVVLTLVLPNFTQTTPGPTLSVLQQTFLVVVAIGLYATFLFMQTGRHRGYFSVDGEAGHDAAVPGQPQILPHTVLLVAYMVPVVVLAEEFARPVDYLTETLGAPAPLAGRHHGSPGGDAGGDRRGARGDAKPLAARGQHFPGLGAVHDRPHGARHGTGQPPDRPRPGARPTTHRFGDAAADVGSQRRHVRKRPHQRNPGRGAFDFIRNVFVVDRGRVVEDMASGAANGNRIAKPSVLTPAVVVEPGTMNQSFCFFFQKEVLFPVLF